MTRLTSCFVHIQLLRKRCMADSVARRPHTATSVRGLISPPSPILVFCLPLTFFSPYPLLVALATICLLPPLPYYPPSVSLFLLIIFIFSPLDPSVIYWLPLVFFFFFLLYPLHVAFLLPPSFPPLRLCVCLKSFCHRTFCCTLSSTFISVAQLYCAYCVWIKRTDTSVP